jgi:hypothetical protein
MIIFWRVMENVTGFGHDANYLWWRRPANSVGPTERLQKIGRRHFWKRQRGSIKELDKLSETCWNDISLLWLKRHIVACGAT